MWNFKEYKDNVAFLEENGAKVKYSDLCNTAKSLDALMPKRALSFILCKNTLGSAVSYVGNYSNHQVSFLVKADLDTDLLQNLIDKYQPQYIFVPSDEEESLGKEISSIKDSDKLENIFDYSLLKTNFNCNYKIYDELSLLLTTSGSTGSPKFVRQSFHNVESNTIAIAKYLHLDSNERPITVLPMYYTFGLSVINSHLEVGATILLTDKSIMQKEFWSFLKDKQATSISGVPYTYQMLNMLRFTRMDLPYLKTLTQAGGHLNVKLQKLYADYCKDNGKEFFVMYGQCEATARMSYLEPKFADKKTGSIGKALDGCKFEIIDEQGNIVTEPNKEGELVFVGPNVTLGYANSYRDLSKGDEREGRLNTGDIGYFDEDGFYFITGRKKRFLKIFGNRVNLEDVDKLIFEKFCNLDFATYGIDDHLYIFLTEHDKEKQDKVLDYVVEKLKLHPSAFKVVVLDKIPRNESGKVLYKELAKHC